MFQRSQKILKRIFSLFAKCQEVFVKQMKHNKKVTLILILMFLVTQFIGLYVINYYSPTKVIHGEVISLNASEIQELPYGMETPTIEQPKDYTNIFISIIIAFVFAISLLFLFTRFKVNFILRLWFFVVVVIALGIFFNTIIPEINFKSLIALVIALPLAFFKIYKRNMLVHNLTELLIYPGIAAVFVPILNIKYLIALLVLISVYDIWAVWHSGLMQKMAKYQMTDLKIFAGFFVPYLSKKTKARLEKFPKSKKKTKKVRANVAVLGGGDVIFPIIAAGVALKTFGIVPALGTIIGATLGLAYLFILGNEKKFYPAMPYISTGIFLGMLIGWMLI